MRGLEDHWWYTSMFAFRFYAKSVMQMSFLFIHKRQPCNADQAEQTVDAMDGFLRDMHILLNELGKRNREAD